MITTRDLQCDRQFRVIVLHHQLARPEQVELQAAAQPSLVDVGEQGIHFRLAGQLLFQQVHVLHHLGALLLQLLEADGALQLRLVIRAERDLFGTLALQLFCCTTHPEIPKGAQHQQSHRRQQHIPRNRRPRGRVTRIQATELRPEIPERLGNIHILSSHRLPPAHDLAPRAAADAAEAAASASLARCNCTRTVKL